MPLSSPTSDNHVTSNGNSIITAMDPNVNDDFFIPVVDSRDDVQDASLHTTMSWRNSSADNLWNDAEERSTVTISERRSTGSGNTSSPARRTWFPQVWWCTIPEDEDGVHQVTDPETTLDSYDEDFLPLGAINRTIFSPRTPSLPQVPSLPAWDRGRQRERDETEYRNRRCSGCQRTGTCTHCTLVRSDSFYFCGMDCWDKWLKTCDLKTCDPCQPSDLSRCSKPGGLSVEGGRSSNQSCHGMSNSPYQGQSSSRSTVDEREAQEPDSRS